jgi:hypothetical protein
MKNSFEDVAQTVLDKSEDSQLYQLFISLGIYASQLETLGRYFDPSQIRIVLFEDLKNDSSQVYLNLIEWLHVSPDSIESKKAHNVTTKAKSSSFAGLINQLKIEGNPLKQFVKRVLPYSVYSKLGSSIEKLNETEAKFESIGIESREILSAHYRSKTQKLQLLLSQEKYAQSIESCSRDNWLFKSPTSS